MFTAIYFDYVFRLANMGAGCPYDTRQPAHGGWKEGFDPFFNAPVVLVVLAPKDWANKTYDGSLVMGNMMLAAHALNIGSCWINRARQEFETEEGKEILKALGIEGEYEGIGHCILGYIDEENLSVPARKPNRVYYVD